MFEDGPHIFQNLGATSKLWAKKGDMQLVPYWRPTDRRYRTRFVHPVCVCYIPRNRRFWKFAL